MAIAPVTYEYSNLGTGITLRPGFFPDSYLLVSNSLRPFLAPCQMISHWSMRPLGVEVLSLPRQDSDIRGLGDNGILGPSRPPQLHSHEKKRLHCLSADSLGML